ASWVNDRDGSPKLKSSDSDSGPSGQKCACQSLAVGEERQIPSGVEHQAVLAIEVREAVGVPQIGHVIDSGIECRVATGSRIERFGPGVGSLEVKRLGEAVCRRDL